MKKMGMSQILAFNKTLIKLFMLSMGLFCLTPRTNGQDHKIYEVKFEFQHSRRIPNNIVSVNIQRFGDSISVQVKTEPMSTTSDKWRNTKRNYVLELSKTEFDKIVVAIQKISCTDIASGLAIDGLDGTICTISYGSFASGISYKVWSPNYDTSKRNLKPYLDACQLILESAKLDPKEIL